jgi:hypothetical protein
MAVLIFIHLTVGSYNFFIIRRWPLRELNYLGVSGVCSVPVLG